MQEIPVATTIQSVGSEPVIRVESVYKTFGEHTVLSDFSMTLGKGENLVILGKSGSGKSVLIKCIIGLMDADAGSIYIFDQNISDLDLAGIDQVRARVGFLFQSNALYDSMTVRENLEFPLRRHWIQVTEQETDAMVIEALRDVGLEHTVDMMPVELSGGMRKRIALARTLILKPDIILYDEPTTGLDVVTSKEIIELMVELKKKYNTSAIIISHDMNCVRMASDRVLLLIDGKAYATGTYTELVQSNDPQVRQFFE